MTLKRKRSASRMSSNTAAVNVGKSAKRKKRESSDKTGRAEKDDAFKFWDLRVLPGTVMQVLVGHMSVRDHTVFRQVCSYANDEIEHYWRSQKVISIPRLLTWFPTLWTSSWRLASLSGIIDELAVAFCLFKPGNLRKLSLCGVHTVNIKSLVDCAELATGQMACEFFERVEELDLRGCAIHPSHLKMLDELFLNLHTILLSPHTVVPAKHKKRYSKPLKVEVTEHETVSTRALRTEVRVVSGGPDLAIIGFVREHLPDVRHVYIDLDT